MESSPEICKEILYQAMREDIGLLLQVSDFPRARQAFYRARADAADPALAVLQFRTSPGLAGGNLIIVKEKITLTPNTAPALSPAEDLHDI